MTKGRGRTSNGIIRKTSHNTNQPSEQRPIEETCQNMHVIPKHVGFLTALQRGISYLITCVPEHTGFSSPINDSTLENGLRENCGSLPSRPCRDRSFTVFVIKLVPA